jgi:hypothetical protein
VSLRIIVERAVARQNLRNIDRKRKREVNYNIHTNAKRLYM